MIYRITLFLGAILLIGSVEMGCYYDNEEDLYNGGGDPDSCNVRDNISYMDDLVPILDTECNTCHNANDRFGNVILDTYDNLAPYVNNGKLMGVINHESGLSPMPPSSKLETCDIARFEKWINEGAADN